MKEYINRLSSDWNNEVNLIIWGFGTVAKRTLHKLIGDFQVVCIIDNDVNKSGTFFNQIPIISYEKAKLQYNLLEYKIVVATSARWYHEIRSLMTGDGLMEHVHFCKLEQFVSEWYWKNRKQVYLLRADTTITTRCTLNCIHCNMFIPYYNETMNMSLEKIQRNADLIFTNIDYIFYYILIGGEPFLNPDLADMVEYIFEKYSKKIGKMAIITNGTIEISEKVLDIIKKYEVEISISDYTTEALYEERLTKLISKLIKKGILYSVNKVKLWNDFGFPHKPFSYSAGEEAKNHMESCAPLFLGINDGKVYYCNVAWSAMNGKLFMDKTEESMELSIIDKHNPDTVNNLLAYCLGDVPKGYLEFCRVCGGCGADNQFFVKAGCQINGG